MKKTKNLFQFAGYRSGSRLSRIKTAGALLASALILAFSGCAGTSAAKANSAPDTPPLKTVYGDYFLMGNIVNTRYVNGDQLDLLVKHFNVATFENDMKPDALAPRSRDGSYNFSRTDRMVDTLLDNDLQIFGHTLVWHNQTPAWMTQGTRAEVQANLVNHINTVAGHYRGKVMGWDVVNEAMRDGLTNVSDWKTCLRDSGWHQALGPDYIELAFRTARAADPDAILYYNDYNMDSSAKSSAVRNMVKDINDRYLAEGNTRKLIEGVGMQSHYNSSSLMAGAVKLSLDKFIEIGVEVSVTELDIVVGGSGGANGPGNDSKMTDYNADIQARLYSQLFTLYKEYAEHIARITMWGIDDYSSWLSRGNPCLFDGNLDPKRAFFAVADPDNF